MLLLALAAAYVGLSVITFAVYGVDKSAARRGTGRISERTLLWLGLLGGWPGGLAAQRVLRHKTAKRSFLARFWITVALNIALLAVILVRFR